MINSKEELDRVLKIESKLYTGHRRILVITETDILFKYVCLLRKAEYYVNTKKAIRGIFAKLRLHRYQCKYGIHIPINTCDEGLSIAHLGPIIINSSAHIGKNARIHVGVNIGDNGNGKVPKIGDNVYIGPGAKIFGDIEIADNVSIGANAVVNKSCGQSNVLLVGVPAVVKTQKNRGIENENNKDISLC